MAQAALNSHMPTLLKHRQRLEDIDIRDLFVQQPERVEKYTAECDGMWFDFSKNRIDDASLDDLIKLVESAKLNDARNKLFNGSKVNFTENRAALHSALRAEGSTSIVVEGENITAKIAASAERLYAFANEIRSNGKITDILHIGIGGSDLGPAMCTRALFPYHDGPNTHYVSNVDGADFHDATINLNPATTLVIIASKSFTTQETMSNARLARHWISGAVGEKQLGDHFAALSSNLVETKAFGISEAHTFGFWDWVGGRYSIWSAIGLSLMIAIGVDNFKNFIAGGRSADVHFQSEKPQNNIPVLMALIGIWHRNVWNFPTHAILPYDNRLSRFPAYLQQLDMESNGKHVCADASNTKYATGPIIWGEPGTNGQHAFFQLLHQGTDIVPCDFLVAANAHETDPTHQRLLVANCFAQSQALMQGRSLEEVTKGLQHSGLASQQIAALAPHKAFEGNRPSNTFLYPKLTPYVLGQLIALFEHKVFVQGVIWGINSFDQWGVELGKQLADQIAPLLIPPHDLNENPQLDASTRALVAKYHKMANQ